MSDDGTFTIFRYLQHPYFGNWMETNCGHAHSESTPNQKESESVLGQHELESSSNQKEKMPHQCLKNHLYVFPSFILVTLPRILGLTYFISRFMVGGNDTATTMDTNAPADLETGYVLAAGILLALFIMYSGSLILTVFWICRKRRSITNMLKNIIMNIGLGILSPCLVFHPESQVLLLTSLISALVHFLLCLSLLVIDNLGLLFIQQSVDDFFVACLVAGLIFSLVPSSILHWMSFEDNRQKFGLITQLGSLSCENEDAFIWACENNHPSLLALSKKPRDEKGKFGKNNGVHAACVKGKLNLTPIYQISSTISKRSAKKS